MSDTQRRFRIGDILARLFAIDLRALGVFRILLAIILLVDYAGRLPDLDAFYTEAGVMPLQATKLYHSDANLWLLWSPYVWNGSHAWSLTLMLLGIVAAIFLLVGWRTRIATAVSWYLLIGLHTRYPLVQEGYDVYIRQMLFWSLFMPLGARFSVDGLAAHHVAAKRPLPRAALSMATAGILLQVGIVYWFNAISKSSPVWWKDFTALYYALSLDAFTTPLGAWVRDNLRWALPPLTMMTIYLEAYGPFFAFIPVATERIRPYVVAAFITFHLMGIGLFMDVGAFHYVASAPWILFLPGSFWDALERIWAKLPFPKVREGLGKYQEACVTWRSGRIARRIQRGMPIPRLSLSLFGQIVAFYFLIYIIHWNLCSTRIGWINRYLPQPRRELMWMTRVDQYWAMFSPMPMSTDIWVVIPAKTLDNTDFDMYAMRTPVNYRKPHGVHEFYKNTRWRKYLTNLYDSQYSSQRPFYCEWLAREWNKTHHGPQALLGLWFCVVESPTPPRYEQPKPKLRVLHRYWAFIPADKPVPEFPPNVPAELLPAPSLTQGVARHGVNRSP